MKWRHRRIQPNETTPRCATLVSVLQKGGACVCFITRTHVLFKSYTRPNSLRRMHAFMHANMT